MYCQQAICVESVSKVQDEFNYSNIKMYFSEYSNIREEEQKSLCYVLHVIKVSV